MSGVAAESIQQRLNLGPVQRRRKLALFLSAIAAALALPFVHSIESGAGFLHETAEIVGTILIACAIVGRSWCSLYIGGRKGNEIVATGPYSISRNPLYAFSLLAVLGIGLQTGSFVMAAGLTTLAAAIFLPVILREEQALTALFGADYETYRRRVPRFGPRISGWRDMEAIVVQPARLRQTFGEALLFLLAIPVCEMIEKLQDLGYFVPLVYLP
jgi:protein-S-isoprenylcysteine O-methyltransferase Ste14